MTIPRNWLLVTQEKWKLILFHIFLLGAYWRYIYIVHAHPPTEYVYSDMGMYVKMAQELFTQGKQFGPYDSFYSPAMSFYLGYLWHLDSTFQLAIYCQIFLSICIPLIAFGIGYDFYGLRVAVVSTVLTTFYYPFVEYFAYFSAEGPMLFFMGLSMWLLGRSLRVQSKRSQYILGFVQGVCMAIAATFKGQAFLGGLLIVTLLMLAARKYSQRNWWRISCGSLAGMLLLIVPVSIRATKLNEGRPTLISSNAAVNMMEGHCGKNPRILFQ